MSDANVVSLHVSMPQLLDLALGTPEVGAVNLNILHNFLHVLLHQINLRSTKVEYRDENANRIKGMLASSTETPSVHLQEYSITDGSGKIEQRDTNVSEVTDVFTNAPDTSQTPGIQQQISSGTESEQQKVIFVEPIANGVTPTALRFKELEKSVNHLQKQFRALEELTTNSELVERLKGKITDPLSDVWQIINITKRLDASEKGIDKLTTMIQDIVKSNPNIGTIESDESEFVSEDVNTKTRILNLEKNLRELEDMIKNLQVLSDVPFEIKKSIGTIGSASVKESPDSPAEMAESSEPHGTGETVIKTSAGNIVQVKSETGGSGSLPTQRISPNKLLEGVNIQELHSQMVELQVEVQQLRIDVNNVETKISNLHDGEMVEKVRSAELSNEIKEEKEIAVTRSIDKPIGTTVDVQEYIKMVQDVEAMHKDTVEILDERLGKLEQDITSLSEKVDTVTAATKNEENEVSELVSKIQGIEGDVEKLHLTADHLIDERETRELHLNALLEQVELLKTIKADKEEIEEALADKADAQILKRKVSYDQFDAACDDLTRGLEDAITKLTSQEVIWQQALDEVQKEIEGKLDKIEISPLREFVTNRLKSIQEKLKSVADASQKNEAAGSKKLLRDVQCISCDKNVVMRTEESAGFRADPLPSAMSMKPYLTYELDQVRKQQKRLPHSRNMVQFEAAVQEETRKQRVPKLETLAKSPRDQLCNRYCGGSHTVITPQQRISRAGHYLDQWGPEIVQLSEEGVVKGTDGKMYRSRPITPKLGVCDPSICKDANRNSVDKCRSAEREGLTSSTSKKLSENYRSPNNTEFRKRNVNRKGLQDQSTNSLMEEVSF